MHRVHHPRDEQLFESYRAARVGEPVDPPTADHLADCAECAARYTEFATFMDSLRTDADIETDAVFTPERLSAQRAAIDRRLEHLGRPARVIAFPGRLAPGSHAPRRPYRATRWVAAAAAAGIFVGVGLGVFYDSDVRLGRARRSAIASITSPAATTTSAADEAFLSELEVAADRPHTRELAPFDALTPHVREISTTTIR